jgi:hypothetical protein
MLMRPISCCLSSEPKTPQSSRSPEWILSGLLMISSRLKITCVLVWSVGKINRHDFIYQHGKKNMNTTQPGSNAPIRPQPARDLAPRRLIVTASVVTFAIRDWSLWVLLREGPWGPPMRLVLSTETVTDAVARIIETLLVWHDSAPLIQLKAGWQEQQVSVWNSTEQGAAVSLIHTLLLRANRDELRPNLHLQPVPSLHVRWIAVSEIERGRYVLDPEVAPMVEAALHTLRSQIQRDPEIVLRYLADMASMVATSSETRWQAQGNAEFQSKQTLPLRAIREPARGDGILTLAEAALLYKAFFPPNEQIDLSNLRRRFLATNRLEVLNEQRPVRGRELDWRRVSRAYRYTG